ncbi:N-acetylmuramoyl-L-alanine amidase [Mycobacterium sp. URHB0044]|jgi:hypothetical protein|uniref:peptidoglycan recognition protein family protein n=1 Tax=Mycobacterium sp. URHB0044 TaxID=1380386 RepID=UPI0009DF2F5D
MSTRNFKRFDDAPLRTREQIAREVHAVSLRRGLDELATVIALMTISTEVGANDRNGQRQWWCPFNRKDPQSEQFPHDSESDDGLSSGYFQQQVSRPGAPGRPWGWGGLFGDINGNRRRMTLAESADMFLEALSDDYTSAKDNPRLAGQFAQRVQGSAFGDRYAGKWDEAWTVLRRALAEGPVRAARARKGTHRGTHRGDPTWLEETLRPVLGDRLKTLDGWQNRGHGDFLDIRGVMVHHTGNSRESAESIRNGRPDLAGPLANLHIAPDGTVTIVAVGVCWHAGRGSYPWLPTNNANWHMIGIECAWPTIHPDGTFDKHEQWPDAQIISMRDTCAALALRLGVSADKVIGHKEYAAIQGKWDPGNIDMNWFRGEVAKDMRGEFRDKARRRMVPPPAAVVVDPCDLRAPEEPRSDRVLLEEIWTVLRGPGGDGWPQLGGKSLVDFLSLLADVPLDAAVAAAPGNGAQADRARAAKAPAKKSPVKRAPAKNVTPAKRSATKKKVPA